MQPLSAEAQQERDLAIKEYNSLFQQHAKLLASTIKGNWINPSTKHSDLAILSLELEPSGYVKCAHIKNSNGDSIFNKSVLEAVDRSNPLPKAPKEVEILFERLSINFYGEQ